jgi:hypothetical protein
LPDPEFNGALLAMAVEGRLRLNTAMARLKADFLERYPVSIGDRVQDATTRLHYVVEDFELDVRHDGMVRVHALVVRRYRSGHEGTRVVRKELGNLEAVRPPPKIRRTQRA